MNFGSGKCSRISAKDLVYIGIMNEEKIYNIFMNSFLKSTSLIFTTGPDLQIILNLEIEKMLEDEKLKKEEAESLKKEKDVQDEEMVEFYSSVASTISKKFANKRNSAGDTLPQPRDELTLCQMSKKCTHFTIPIHASLKIQEIFIV